MNTFVSLCLIGGLSLGSLCYAQHMDNDAKKKVIKDLENLLALNRSAETKVINAAISKLNSAGRDPSAAYDLLIQSKKFLMEAEKEKDKSQGKSAKIASNSLKDWMDREAKKYQDKNARKGLMLQYQWGVLVLRARLKENLMNATSSATNGAEEESLDVTEFQKPAMDLLNAYLSACADPDFIDPSATASSKNNGGGAGKSGARIAEQSVLNTEVGEALGISSMSSKAFPDSMKNRDEIFDKLFFTGYRKTRNLPALRQAWSKRISMEVALGKVSHAISTGKKSGMQGRIANASEDEFDEQDSSILDRLRWRCELDCFDLGDQANATRNMMTLIRTTVDPVRREQGIRTLRDKLIQSMKSMVTASEDGSMADSSSSSSSAAPRPAVRPPRRKTPPTTITTSREMDDPGAIGTDVPKPPKPDPTRSDDFFEDA
ncbi:hypothetical protein [Akkermansia muciniphila]|uniref:hypothetical protein n=1 Tax=Akkermansia muciniphila TaxID=239935 RepID=UPI001BFF3843|nr:hypothetical protein [Akkermansia muciniphila]MBT8779079.1 hypothetical protein [Akkermansia muciniphila]